MNSSENTENVQRRTRKRKINISVDDARNKNVERITNIFSNYISDVLETINLPPDREKTRVDGLVENLKNSFSLKKQVYPRLTEGKVENLVTSTDGKETYTVQPKANGDTIKYVCNCGNKYDDIDRNSCKHCGSVVLYNLDNFLTEYLTKKTTPNIGLQLHNVNRMFNKVDIKNCKIEEVDEVDTLKLFKKSNFENNKSFNKNFNKNFNDDEVQMIFKVKSPIEIIDISNTTDISDTHYTPQKISRDDYLSHLCK